MQQCSTASNGISTSSIGRSRLLPRLEFAILCLGKRFDLTILKRCFLLLSLASFLILSGCIQNSEEEVVVYCALDKEFSETILNEFSQKTGIKVLPKFDQESNKTVGLANEIIQQKDKQRCDLFWNNEILHTLRLKNEGLLQKFEIAASKEFPSQFVSTDSDWFGFAARARVFLVNVDLLPDKNEWPTSIQDLVDPKWKNKCAMAKPLFGTTATHAAVIYSKLGKEKATQFFKQMADNVSIESGNKQVAINVSRGLYPFGITDTDDAIIEIEQGEPVAIVFPDQEPNQPGTLFIPNTLAITKGQNSKNAKPLLEFLLTKEVEEQLAAGRSAQIPLHSESNYKSRVEPDDMKVMEVDFQAAANVWEDVKIQVKEIFSL